MADNYLENKMEEHRRAMAAPRQRTSGTLAQKALAEAIGWTAPAVLIHIADKGLLAAIVTNMRHASCRVAFICTDAIGGRELAQRTGAMHIPYDDIARAEALLESRCTPATFRIEGDSDTLTVASADHTWTISRQPSTDAQHFAQASARLCAYLAIPLSASLTPSEIVV